MTGNERSSVTILGAAAVGNVALNYILIPPLGPTGAAIATALTLGVSRVALSRIVQKRLGVYAGVLGSPLRGKTG
jgi:O-antigen/teichoic acid export membrane protein